MNQYNMNVNENTIPTSDKLVPQSSTDCTWQHGVWHNVNSITHKVTASKLLSAHSQPASDALIPEDTKEMTEAKRIMPTSPAWKRGIQSLRFDSLRVKLS